MGTTLELETKVGEGSTFFFDLPLSKAPGRREKARVKTSVSVDSVQRDTLDGDFAHGYPLKVLAVDDSPVNRKLLAATLKKLGYANIETATCGGEAIAVLDRAPIDLIFMDLQMPGMDGISATTKIRAKEAALSIKSPVKIVAVTANSSTAVRNECFAAGMNYYVSKPFNAKSLAAAIIAVLAV
jgi:CheY-like chemotaxis protein